MRIVGACACKIKISLICYNKDKKKEVICLKK